MKLEYEDYIFLGKLALNVSGRKILPKVVFISDKRREFYSKLGLVKFGSSDSLFLRKEGHYSYLYAYLQKKGFSYAEIGKAILKMEQRDECGKK